MRFDFLRFDFLKGICSYLKVSMNFMHLIFSDRFWFVYISFVSIVKFPFFAQFLRDHLSCQIMPVLVFLSLIIFDTWSHFCCIIVTSVQKLVGCLVGMSVFVGLFNAEVNLLFTSNYIVSSNLLTRKKNLPSSRFCYSGWPQCKNKRKWKDKQILGPCQRTKKKAKGHEGGSNMNCNWSTSKGLKKRLKELEIKGSIMTIQIKVLLRSSRIPIRVLKTRGYLLSLRLQWKTPS